MTDEEKAELTALVWRELAARLQKLLFMSRCIISTYRLDGKDKGVVSIRENRDGVNNEQSKQSIS